MTISLFHLEMIRALPELSHPSQLEIGEKYNVC